jgi:hypothetical protein
MEMKFAVLLAVFFGPVQQGVCRSAKVHRLATAGNLGLAVDEAVGFFLDQLGFDAKLGPDAGGQAILLQQRFHHMFGFDLLLLDLFN